MSVAYQSWEVSSGPTVGYKVGPQGNHCGADGSNYRIHPQQDSVIRGLSALSLYMHSHSEAEGSREESKGQFECAPRKKESPSLVLVPPQTAFAEGGLLKEELDVCPLFHSTHVTSGKASSVNLSSSDENHRFGRFYGLPERFGNSYYTSNLDVVSEDRAWENCPVMEDTLDADTTSSSCSLSDTPADGFCPSAAASQVTLGDMEAESAYKGPLDGLSSPEASLPSKRGLSRYFSGKSRSFSCLADVVSVKDLPKPENPYARKRKNLSACSGNSERPRLHPMRNGAAGISKKPPHSGKCTLALAVAMSSKESLIDTEEQQDFHAHVGILPRSQCYSAPPRSFSLSDLQGAGNCFTPK